MYTLHFCQELTQLLTNREEDHHFEVKDTIWPCYPEKLEAKRIIEWHIADRLDSDFKPIS